MITLNQLFTLIINCTLLGSTNNIDDHCILPSMVSTPYIAIPQDENLPAFEDALWYTFPFENTLNTNLEILIKNDEILQVGIELTFYQDKFDCLIKTFYELNDLAIKEFGDADFSHIYSIPEYQISDLRTYNYKYKDKIFYIRTSNVMGLSSITFRAGNSNFYN